MKDYIRKPNVLKQWVLLVSTCMSNVATGSSILDIQSFKAEQKIEMPGQGGSPATIVKFTNLNSQINSWYLLEITWDGKGPSETYHLESADPIKVHVTLDNKSPTGLMVRNGNEPAALCPLWEKRTNSPLEEAKKVGRNFVEVCSGKLFLRNPAVGRETTKEVVVDFLRRHVWGGESITGFVKETFFKDKFVLMSNAKEGKADVEGSMPLASRNDAPPRAQVQSGLAQTMVAPVELGLDLGAMNGKDLDMGSWYPVTTSPGIFLSVLEPGAIQSDILNSYPDRVKKLDTVESKALSYMVAFDLARHDIGFALGTKHPSMEWSERSLAEYRDPNKKAGPDGFDSAEPLIRTGAINPNDAAKVVATFIGGYKRNHGAFKWGELATKNNGSHYGFIENGVVFSTLVPGLATIIIYRSGQVDMKTWTEADNKDLRNIRYARQNGVSVVEWDAKNNQSMPGSLVSKWTQGNWSGSQDSQQRTLRSGACLVKEHERNFLLYGYFSGATAPAMARVFQAYGCNYGIHLDMNALEHTYLAVYSQFGTGFMVQHLISGMNVLDRSVNGLMVPRFVGTPDNRDFFYVMKR